MCVYLSSCSAHLFLGRISSSSSVTTHKISPAFDPPSRTLLLPAFVPQTLPPPSLLSSDLHCRQCSTEWPSQQPLRIPVCSLYHRNQPILLLDCDPRFQLPVAVVHHIHSFQINRLVLPACPEEIFHPVSIHCVTLFLFRRSLPFVSLFGRDHTFGCHNGRSSGLNF